VTSSLDLSGAEGIADVVSGAAALEDVLQTWGDSSLAVLGAGSMPERPERMLSSPALPEVIERLRAAYDYVLIDTAPLLAVTDAVVLSALADGCVLVARYGRTRRAELAEAVERMARLNAKVLGAVLTRVPTAAVSTRVHRHRYEPDAERVADGARLPDLGTPGAPPGVAGTTTDDAPKRDRT
jgi:polysaccharide biosynthesis transport protein